MNAVERAARRHAADFRADIERQIQRDPSALERFRRFCFRALGAVSVGFLAAGFSIFVLVILLNLVFHFSPA